MIATVFSAGIYGIEGYLVTVECGLVNGLPSFELVGLPGAAVKESKARVTTAARSIGMNALQTMFVVILPQAVKNSFPAIGNEFVVNIKDSSVLNAISVTDLFFQSMSVAGSIYQYTNTMLVTACIYLVLTFTTTRILYAVEKRMGRPRSSMPASQTMPKSGVL